MNKKLGDISESDLVGRRITRVKTTDGFSAVLLDDGSVIGMTTEWSSYIPVVPWLVGKEAYLALKPRERTYHNDPDMADEVKVTVKTREVVPTGRVFERTDVCVTPEQEFTLEMMSYILHNESGLVPRYNHELMLVEFWKLTTD